MKVIVIFLAAASMLRGAAAGAGLPPWQFGMTPAQVTSFKQFGPYKPFRNGDLETFNGQFHGRKQNIQFFFRGGRLGRIGVYFHQSTDRKKAVVACQQLYELLERDYGPVNIPEDKSPRGAKSAPPGALAIAATANADVFGETHLIPTRQPADMQVSGTVMSTVVAGQKWFYVALFFDPRT
jgi:hypothetical protein